MTRRGRPRIESTTVARLVLSTLRSESPRFFTQAELSARLDLGPGRVRRALYRMLSLGLVERRMQNRPRPRIHWRVDVARVVRSVLDEGTCDECRAADGARLTPGEPSRAERRPPIRACTSPHGCRCWTREV